MKNRVILGEKAQLSLPKVFIYAIFKFKLPPEIVIIKSGLPDEFRCVCYFLEVIFPSQTVYKFSRLYHNLQYALTNSSHYKQYWPKRLFRAPWITCDVAVLYNLVSVVSFDFFVRDVLFAVSGVLNMSLTISQISGFLARHNCNYPWSYSPDPLDGYLPLPHLFTLLTIDT